MGGEGVYWRGSHLLKKAVALIRPLLSGLKDRKNAGGMYLRARLGTCGLKAQKSS